AKNGRQYRCVVSFIGEGGDQSAYKVTDAMIRDWSPKTIVLLGLAGRISDDARLADVIVAKEVEGYLDDPKAVPGQSAGAFEVQFSSKPYIPGNEYFGHADNIEFAHKNAYIEWQHHCAEDASNLLDSATFDALLNDKKIRKSLQAS